MCIDLDEIRTAVRRITRETGSPLFDEDLEQEAALRALEAFRKAPRIDHPRAFLHKVVRDVVRDHWRSSCRLRLHPLMDLDKLDERFIIHRNGHPTIEEDLDRERLAKLVQSAIAKLGRDKQMLVDLFYVQGYPVHEIAQMHQRSSSSVKMSLARSRREIARMVRSMTNKKSR